MNIEVLTEVATGWEPSLETIGIIAVIVTAFFVAVQAVAVCLQAWYIHGGLEQMREASKQRDKQLDQQAVDSERRHRESMEANEQRHRESMRGLEALGEQNREESRAMMRALEALIERTAPPPHGAVG